MATRKPQPTGDEPADEPKVWMPPKRQHTRDNADVVPPRRFTAAEIRKLRERLDVSQPIFAKLLGVSSVVATQWETGRTTPRRTTRLLMEEVLRDPEGYLKRRLRPKAPLAGRRADS
jgi:DNA-binding transcriptional regulator YiaG